MFRFLDGGRPYEERGGWDLRTMVERLAKLDKKLRAEFVTCPRWR